MSARLIVSTLAAALALASCSKDPIETRRTDNPNISAELLVTIDGCRVYRFYDERAVYVTVCQPSSKSASVVYSHLEVCGKNCWVEVQDNSLAAYRP